MNKDGVKVVRDEASKIMTLIKALTGRDVLVGIPSSATARKEKGDPMDNATLGYIHEFGAPAAGIPARPFLLPGVADAQAGIAAQLGKAATAALNKDANETDARLHAAGMVAQNSVKRTINSDLPPPLAEGTLAARRRRGRTGTVALIDTGQLRNSITYVVRQA